jgi:hypothetical protein
MATARKRRLKAAAVAGAVTLVAATGALLGGGSPASAEVTTARGNAFGASASTTLLGNILPPTANVSNSASVPATGYPLTAASTLPITVPGVISIGVANGSTVSTNLGTHQGTVTSSASVAAVNVGISAVTADVISSTCTANGDGAVGSTQLVNAIAGGNPLLQTPLANTVINIPGIATVTLNEQIPFPDPHTPGVEDLIVNAVHVQLLPSVIGAPVVDIVLAHSECHVAGPDVNEVTTTPTTGGTGTTATTNSTGTTATTNSTGTTATTNNTGTTATTNSTGGTVTTNISGVTTIPGGGTGGGSVVAGALARTGAFLSNAFVWGALVIFLGGLALLGSKGEVQTWPPKRSGRRHNGPKRSGSSWPNNRGRSNRRFF